MTKYTCLLFSLLSSNLVCQEPSREPSRSYQFEETKSTLPAEENNIAEQAHTVCAGITKKHPIPFRLFFPQTDQGMAHKGTLSQCPDLEENYSSSQFSHPTKPTITAATIALRSKFFSRQPTGAKMSLVKSVNGSEQSFLFQLTRPDGTTVYSNTCGALMHTAHHAQAFLLICTLSSNPNGDMDTVNKLVPIKIK